jgi:hypothetical protein
MPQAILAREQLGECTPRSRLGLLIFIPSVLLWISLVVCMLPITVLAFPAEWLFKDKPQLHANAVMTLVLIGAANAVIVPASVIYILCA